MRHLVVVLVLLCACRTMQPVEHANAGSLAGEVEAGDYVEVRTRDGRTLAFTVLAVTDDAIVGETVRVPRADIEEMRVKAVSKARTFGAAFGGAGLWILMLIGASSAAILSGG
jgi:hypothetical protein